MTNDLLSHYSTWAKCLEKFGHLGGFSPSFRPPILHVKKSCSGYCSRQHWHWSQIWSLDVAKIRNVNRNHIKNRKL